MVRYRRNFIPGGTYFFTVTLRDRRAATLVDHIGTLRAAFATTQTQRPFATDAAVVLPEHLHTLITLPHLDHPAGRRRRLSRALAAHQKPVHHGGRQVRQDVIPEDWGAEPDTPENFGEPRSPHEALA